NFVRWPILGEYVSPNRLPPGAGPGEYYETYEKEVDYLKQWILDRMYWMDTEIIFENSYDIPFLVINEINYNPSPDQGTDDNYEFIEIFNAGNSIVDLENFAFTDGVEFTFPAGTYINPFEHIVIANNAQIYLGNEYQIFEWDSGKLANEGERILLTDVNGNIIDEVTFMGDHTWPDISAGSEPPIELISPILVNDLGKNWTVSEVTGGTPGKFTLEVGFDSDLGIPQLFTLHQNYPNPFNNKTTFRYTLTQDLDVSLIIYDLNGKLIKTLVDQSYRAGTHQVQWDGRDKQGRFIGSGVYLYRLNSGDRTTTRKFVLIK
ncbi:MAG: lamin tail domain-containing protein, partial [Candidatus Neomarinimicrobiota bacterium]